MATFYYKVGDKTGSVSRGSIDADNVDQAAEKLKGMGYHVLSVNQAGGVSFGFIKDKLTGLTGFGAEMSSLDRVLFTTNFAEMLKTGLPIIEAISTFEDEGSSPRARKMFSVIVSDIRSGLPPSKAFSKFPRTFSSLYTNIMASGETTGTIGETMSYLATQLKKDHELTSRVRGAMIYPVVVLTVMFLVVGFITFTVIPKITTFAESLGQDLPLATKILVNGNKFIVKNFPFLITGAIVLIGGFLRLIKTERGKKVFDKIMLKLPIFGVLVRKFNQARFCRLLGAFYHYGISLPQAFETLSASMGNYYYRKATDTIKENIARGVALSDAMDLEDRLLFPKIMVRVVRGAEKSAGVDESLWRLAEFYETDLENSLKNLTTIIEPLLIIVLGIGIVGIAVAVVVPIYKVTTSFK